jgi:hypothetical protein
MNNPFANVEYLLRCDLGSAEAQLGIALQYEFSPPGIKYSAPYEEMGRELWSAVRYEIWDLLCDRTDKTAKKWTEELIAGDARDLVVALATLIASQLDVTLSIAVPAAAILVKRRVHTFCSRSPKRPKRSVADILITMRAKVSSPKRKKKS